MKTLNLSDEKISDIKYKISQFPDGQQDIVLLEDYKIQGFHGTQIVKEVIIESRFNSFRDLELIICATKALKRLGVKEIHLYIPYLLGARSDRHFQEGGNSYLVDVIAPIINAQNFETVTVLDVHSDVAPACINNLRIESNKKLVKFALADIYNFDSNEGDYKGVIVSPDAGASKKIYKLLEECDLDNQVIICSKFRDINGKLSNTEVPLGMQHFKGQDFIIIDDICDGGRTFIEIAKVILGRFILNGFKTKPRIYLIVTHGIFSKGYTELLQYFDTIYTTNSIKDIGGLDGNSNKKINVKQLKVI